MTVLPDLLPCVLTLMQQKYTGTLNLTNPGVISHNEILELYQKYVDPSFTWENFTIGEQNEVIDSKRSNNHLDTTLLQSLFPDILPIHDSVENLMKQYKMEPN